MTLTSHRKGIPALGILGILAGGFLAAFGVTKLGGGDLVKSWGNILMGLCLLVSWTENIRSQIIQIVVDESVIRFRRRYRPDSVIRRSDLIDSQVGSSRIRFRYKGPLDVQSASISLRRFDDTDVRQLRMVFAEEEPAQQVAASDRDKPPV